jgi:hypothetical protein
MKTVTLQLNGAALVLGPILAATIRDNKAAIAAARKSELEPPEMLELTCILATACAQRVTPTVTLAQIEDVVDMANFTEVFGACWGVSTPEVAPGEALQAAQAAPALT